MAKNNNPGKILKGTKATATLKSASGVWTLDEAMQAHRANAWPQPNLFQPVSNSLRLKSASSTALVRQASRPGNQRTWTWSGWVKRGLVDLNYRSLFATGSASDYILFWNDNSLAVSNFNNTDYIVRTTQLFRDPSAWYHLVIAMDTTQATSSNRIKIYVNGVQVTAFAVSTYPSQNYTTKFNANTAQYLGYNEYNHFDGQMGEVNLVDGHALQPSLFGKLDTNNTWVPVAYTGSYGTNGFYLPFNNTVTSQTLGYDASVTGTATYDADQDPYRGSVALHLTGNGPAGGNNNVFSDSSSNNLAITRSGSTTQGSFSPFPLNANSSYNPAVHGASAYFNGSSDYLTVGSFPAIGTQDFTVECWVYANSTATTGGYNPRMFDLVGIQLVIEDAAGRTCRLDFNDANSLYVTSSGVFQINQWNHIAVVRISNIISFYLNGAAQTGGTRSDNLLGGTGYIGVYRGGTLGFWNGYNCGFRAIIGKGVYTAAFTPTMRPFGTLTNNLITFSENFDNTSSWNRSGTTSIASSAVAPDGNPSASLLAENVGGSVHYIDLYRVFTTGIAHTNSIYVKPAGRSHVMMRFYTDNSVFSGQIVGFNLITGTVGYTSGSVTASIQNVGNGWYRLVATATTGASATGYIGLYLSDVAVTTNASPSYSGDGVSGVYVWGAQLEVASSVTNYTPTPANFSTAPSLLLNFANSAVVDTSGSGNIVTVSGATITSAAKYGSGALSFNGSSDYFQSSWSLSPFLSPGANNWTLETWVNMTKSLSSAQVIVGYGYESGTTRSFVWYYNGDGTFRLAQSPDGTTNYDAGFGAPQGGFVLNTWYHLAIVRNSGAMTMYVNGKAMPNTLSAYTISSISTGYFRIGVEAATYFGGSMDDLRYTKGVARYTTDFAPPARALPETGGKSFVTTNVNAGVVQRFTTTGTTAWTAPTDVTSVEVLVVAGGGGGGGKNTGGGGGAGGLIYNSSYPVTPGQTYTVAVGAGGSASSGYQSYGGYGGNSVFGNLTAIGGGGGGYGVQGGTRAVVGRIGGSGGGGGGDDTGGSFAGGTGTAGQGFAGGQGTSPGANAGGGGGAGAVGENSVTSTRGGNGGAGLQFGISGTPTFYAGGGGGGGNGTAGTGSVGGGGAGAAGNPPGTGTSGTANTGGGGGGCGGYETNNISGAGGSGVVIVRYTTTAVGNTSDATTDNLTDSPTQYGHDYGNGGEVVGNYATMNPLMGSTLPTFSNGNLTTTGNSGNSSFGCVYSSIAMTSGNWYAEVRLDVLGTNQTQLGVASYIYPRDNSNQNGLNNGLVLINFDNSLSAYRGVYQNGSVLTGGNVGMTFSAGDIIGVAFNATARTVAFYQNGVSLGSSSPYSVADVGTGQFYFVGLVGNLASTKLSWNFGQRAWAYTPPAGFSALTTKNLPRLTNAAAIAPNQYFDAVTYTGNGTNSPNALTVSSLNFQPDLIWIKNRGTTDGHWIQDTVRGLGFALNSNTTGIDLVTGGGDVSSVTSTGFVISYANSRTNASANNYVAWCWRAGGAPVSNGDGNIASQVSANTTSGFSIVSYTGTGVQATVGHGLPTAPSFIILKSRTNATRNWAVYHSSFVPGEFVYLNLTGAKASDNSAWGPVTSTTFQLGNGITPNTSWNQSGNTFIAYCWAEVPGFSKIGSYVGNGSADGPFVYTGFRPAFILTKDITTGDYWWEMVDSARAPFNPSDKTLYANVADSEYTSSGYNKDLLSNGFKIRGTSAAHNTSGSTYIYMAFAGKPFGNANGTAR